MLSKIKLTLVLLLTTLHVLAQQNGSNITLNKIIPPSPNAGNLASFFDKPIGLYTGTPQVSIPIYSIKYKDIEVPITLNYNSGGIKVADIASWCGLGWNLIAGGQITRTIFGLADEMPTNGYLNTPVLSTEALDTTDPVTQNLIVRSVRGELDQQPDQFHFSFPSSSGKFAFNKSGQINSIPLNNYRFKPTTLQNVIVDDIFPNMDAMPAGGLNNKNYTKWEITDDKGTIYRFEAFERSCTTTRDISTPTVVNGGFPGINTWLLTEILTVKGDYIKFNYDTYLTSYDIKTSKTYNKIDISTIDPNYQMLSVRPSDDPVQRQFSENKRLASIEFNSGVVRFIPTQLQRADLIGDQALDKIIVEDKAGQVLKQFKFEYNYLYENGEVPYNNFASQMVDWNNYYVPQQQLIANPKPVSLRLVLKNVREFDGNNNPSNEGYKLDYIAGLPERTSDRTDFWGGFSGKNAPEMKFVSNGVYSLTNVIITNKEPDLTASKAGVLSKITYPTQGTTSFDYGLNQINASSAVLLPDKVEEITGFEQMTVNYATFNQLSLPYVIRRIFPGQNARHYYLQFTIPPNVSSVGVKIKIQSLPPSALSFNFYLENTVNPQPIDDPLWSTAANGEYTISLPAGTYRLYHNPFTDIINNPQHQYYTAAPWANVSFSAVKVIPSDGLSDREVGGLRINAVTHFEPVSGTSLKHRFLYSHDGYSSGYLAGSKQMFLYSTWRRLEESVTTGYPGVKNHAVQVFKYAFNSFFPLSTTSGSYVGYSTVQEISGNNEGNDMGKTVSFFSSPKDVQDNISENGVMYQMPTPVSYGFDPWYPTGFVNWKLPNPPVNSQDWKRGLLLHQEFYKSNGLNSFSLKKKVDNTFEYPSVNLSSGVDVGYAMQNENNSNIYSTGEVYMLRPYTLTTGISMIKQSVETDFDNLGNASVNTISYNNSLKSLQALNKEVIASDGSVNGEYYTYPKEYAPGSAMINNLITQNIVAFPIESIFIKKKENNTYIVGARLNEYYSTGAGLLKSVKSVSIDAKIPYTSFKFSNAPVGQIPALDNQSSFDFDARYENRVQFNTYNSNGDLLEQQITNGSKTSYLYSYKNQYPIAEIKNADYATIESILGGAAAVSSFAASNPTDVTLNALISMLRNSPLLKDAQITSYTYKPLVGLTSSTDAKGMTTYYNYDAFQRLKAIKDQNNNILKQTDYHYKN